MPQTQHLQPPWQTQSTDYITAIVWLRNDLAIATADGTVQIHRSDGTLGPSLRSADGQAIAALTRSADGAYLAAAGQAGEVWIWRMASVPVLIKTLEYSGNWIEHLAWSPIAALLAIGVGSDVVIWDVLADRVVATLPFEDSSVLAIDWQPQGEWLAIGGYQNAKIWSTQDWAAEPEILMVDAASVALQWSPDGRFLASGNLERSITVVDWAARAVPWQMRGFPGKVRQVAWSQPNSVGNSLLASSSAEGIVLWVKSADEEVGWDGQVIGTHARSVTDLAWHPQQPLVLAAVSQDGTGGLFWPIGSDVESLSAAVGLTCVAWHPEGRWLAAGGADGTVVGWKILE
jgi:Eukaryotic translation initiation factor eIF2A/WD domain, G-beta repeat